MNVYHPWLLRVRPAFLASFLKQVLQIKRSVITSDHGRFFIDPASNFGHAVTSDSGFEPEMVEVCTSLLQAGDTFLDIGANEGFFSMLASKLVGDRGKVISIEPQSRLQPILFRNISENHAYNVRVFQVAIADSMGMAELCLSPDMNTGSSGLVQTTRYKTPTETVPQMPLGEFLSWLDLDRIKLMKIDVEGFEYEAILGAQALFESGMIEHIALELHPTILQKRGKSEQDILHFLNRCGYQANPAFSTLVLSKVS